MPHIQVLDQITIDKIAAGEVVERPASVIKELTENAIDAGSTAIVVEIEEGGIAYMRVSDNGCGIDKNEVRSAFLRHSTSKIRSDEDLRHISTLGFRGEALSSISAVSMVELITKQKDSLLGTRYVIEGGKEKTLEDAGAKDGTTFIIRQLFYNTPARRKFLKTPMTEAAHINDIMTRLALSHPEISFQFINNGQTKLHTSGNGQLKDVIYHIYGRDVANNLIPLTNKSEGITISGFLGKPVITRGNRNFENYYINHRYVKNNVIAKAIEDGYKDYTMQHKYPFVVLMLDIDPEKIDVNVHPTKMELRFMNQQQIYNLLYEAVFKGLREPELIPEVDVPEPKKDEAEEKPVKEPVPEERDLDYFMNKMKERVVSYHNHNSQAEVTSRTGVFDKALINNKIQQAVSNRKNNEAVNGTAESAPRTRIPERFESYKHRDPSPDFDPAPEIPNMVKEEPVYSPAQTEYREPQNTIPDVVPEETPADQPEAETGFIKRPDLVGKGEQLDLFEEKMLERDIRQEYKIIGQVFDTYWMVEFHDQLYIIDQHAAHERVLYEKTLRGMKNREYTSQYLNPPIILSLSMQEANIVEAYKDRFQAIGFEIEPFGGNEYAVRAIPDNLFGIAKKELLLEMIDDLDDGLNTTIKPDLIDERIATMSCKAAVKGTSKLSFREVETLIAELLTLDNPYHCPHGRPTIITMTKREMEKKFKRIV